MKGIKHVIREYKLVLAGLFIVFPMLLSGQERQTYQGELHVGQFIGDATYQYLIQDGDTLRDGTFKMQRSSLDALLDKEDVTFFFSGGFKENHPDGNWQFQFGEFRSDRSTEVIGFHYKVNVSGVQEQVSGNMRMGKPEGLWTFNVSEIQDSDVTDVRFNSTIEFEEGIPQKSFKIQKRNLTLVGRTLRNGLAHDAWSLFSDNEVDALQTWNFENGQLKSMATSSNGIANSKEIYPTTIENAKTINLDERYFQVLKIQSKPSEVPTVSESTIGDILAQNANYYAKIDSIFSRLGEAEFSPGFKVSVPHFPLDSLETRQLDSVTHLVRVSKDISKRLISDTHLNILKLSDHQAGFLFEVVKKIADQFVHPLSQLMEYREDGVIDYVSRERLFDHLWPEGMPSTTIEVYENDSTNTSKSFSGPKANSFDFSSKDISSVYNMASYAYTSLDSIQNVLEVKLIKEKRQQDLEELEKRLLSKANAINKIIDSVGSNFPARYKKVLQNIAIETEKELASYSAMDAPEQKITKALELVDCFDSYERLSGAVASQPSRSSKIKERYLDAIWNPFMANIMDEEVKKRLTTAYGKVLIPHVMKSIESDLSCENAPKLSNILDAAYERMLELRDAETSKLERKLRKEENPETIIQLLNLETKVN